jgi:uncharacterized membrane protein (UPF0127 family)
MLRIAAIIALCFLAIPAQAATDGNTSQPLVYMLTRLIIDRKPAPATTPDAATPAPTEPMTQPQLLLDIEVRDAINFYRQDGWINLTSRPEGSGVLLAFQQLSQDPIVPAQNYAPLDILMIDAQGIITEIAPSLVLANLEYDIYPGKPVKAFLLLAGGSCAKFSIKPGDEVQYSLFKKPPPVITEGAPAPAPPPAEAETKLAPAPAPATGNALGNRRAPNAQPTPRPKN